MNAMITTYLIKDFNMNGFEQIKSFYSWVFNNPDKVKPTHISLYLFLLNQNNRSMWVEWFKCPFDLAMQGSCIGSKSTYYKSLKDLQSFGLIEYREGLNNYKAPLIKLICLYKNEPLTEQVTVPLSEPLTVPLTEQLSVQLPEHIYKLITNNIKLITDNQSKFEVFLNSLKNGGKEKSVVNKIPSFEDFLSYALEREPLICEVSLKNKYDSWVVNNWRDGNDNKISNWKSKLINTLQYIKTKEDKTINCLKKSHLPSNYNHSPF